MQDWIPVQQLSSGMKKVLLIITDVLTLPKESIYMIDEYENSLGINAIDFLPQFILDHGKDIQFIITTHSPQMLGEVKPSQIIMLQSDDNNDISYSHPDQSYGLTSNQILDYLMVTPGKEKQILRNESVAAKIKNIQMLIDKEELDEALSKIEELETELKQD